MQIPFFPGSKGDGNLSAADLQRRLEQRDAELADLRNRVRQLEAALDTRAAEAASLRRIGEATGQVVNADEILPLIAEIAVEVTATDSAMVYLFNESHDTLVMRATTDEAAQEYLGKIKCKIGEGITGWVAREKQHVAITSEAFADERFKFVPELNEDRYQSMLSVPLIWRGECIGVINVRTHAPHDYNKTQVQLLSSIA
jgi:signal transduction protein with GAF and PtsI domain